MPSQPSTLTPCDQEWMHQTGRIQSHGCLVAVTMDWSISHVSANLEALLGVTPGIAIGAPVETVVSTESLHDIRGRMQLIAETGDVETVRDTPARRNSTQPFDVAVHYAGHSVVMEFEPAPPAREPHTADLRAHMRRLSRAPDRETLLDRAARAMRALTGFDRVMVYQFHHDGSGEVIAETMASEMEGFKTLRFPASDIPERARALYLVNRSRLIADINDSGAPVTPPRAADGAPIDLSMASLRAVSPIHLEYLRNMGVAASMSVSIVIDGKLWGLFACHHRTPRIIAPDQRLAAELFGELFANTLHRFETEDLDRRIQTAHGQHDRIMALLADNNSVGENFEMIADALADAIPHDGIAGWIDGGLHRRGETPTRAEFMALIRFLNTTAASRVFETDNLGKIYPAGVGFAERAAGLLALPVSRTPRDYIVLFRRELVQTVAWAGDPNKTPAPLGRRLSPRKSFDAWRETVRGMCRRWTDADCRTAEALRVTMLEVVLRILDSANFDRRTAQERQELLIAELNHRVRNILNLIRGVVAQSRAGAGTIEDFTGLVDGRIQSLARAHDQITRENWQSASLNALIRTELETYFAAKMERIVIDGPDVFLQPQALTTLALVTHELTTNSAKYGALSDSRGALRITLGREPDGAVRMSWRESGGPKVKPPQRRGFGSTIIDSAVTFELGGRGEARFPPEGFEADFTIPPIHIAEVLAPAPEADRKQAAAVTTEAPPLTGDVLVLEDNLIIALEAQRIVERLGAERGHLASAVGQALDMINGRDFTFALLDVNLGGETSLAVARRLSERGVPFIFATGYGDSMEMTQAFAAPTVQKPYALDCLRAAVHAVLTRDPGVSANSA